MAFFRASSTSDPTPRLSTVSALQFGDGRIGDVWIADEGIKASSKSINGAVATVGYPKNWDTAPRHLISGFNLKSDHIYVVVIHLTLDRHQMFEGITRLLLTFRSRSHGDEQFAIPMDFLQCGAAYRGTVSACAPLISSDGVLRTQTEVTIASRSSNRGL